MNTALLVCIAVQLLRGRFGQTLRYVPLALLRFLARSEFRYGVRSIAHLIELIPYQKNIKVLHVNNLDLPIDNPKRLKASSLAYHLLHDDHGPGFWATLGRIMPDYEVRRARLRELGPRLVW